MVENLLIGLVSVAGGAVFFGGIALLVYLDQRGKTQRRHLEHLERLRAIEAGAPLADSEVARAHALGAIGVASAVSSMSAGLVATMCIVSARDAGHSRAEALAFVWLACAGVGGLGVWLSAMRLRASTPQPTTTTERQATAPHATPQAAGTSTRFSADPRA